MEIYFSQLQQINGFYLKSHFTASYLETHTHTPFFFNKTKTKNNTRTLQHKMTAYGTILKLLHHSTEVLYY